MAGYAGACHRAALCADPVGSNPPYGLTCFLHANRHPLRSKNALEHDQEKDRAQTKKQNAMRLHRVLGLLQRLDGVADVGVQPSATRIEMCEDRLAHARV